MEHPTFPKTTLGTVKSFPKTASRGQSSAPKRGRPGSIFISLLGMIERVDHWTPWLKTLPVVLVIKKEAVNVAA